MFDTWKHKIQSLKVETYALYLAARDPRTPWYAKALAACVLAYALSPIDLIPDPIPVLGHLDDFVIVPLGLCLVRALIPKAVLTDCRRRAVAMTRVEGPWRWVGACVVVGLWIAVAILTVPWVLGFFKSPG